MSPLSAFAWWTDVEQLEVPETLSIHDYGTGIAAIKSLMVSLFIAITFLSAHHDALLDLLARNPSH